jgi:S-formylglutathione hydrolase FrmB
MAALLFGAPAGGSDGGTPINQAGTTSSATSDAVIPAQTFRCEALGREVNYSAFVPAGAPPDGGWPLVMLLHGAGRNHRTIPDDPTCRVLVLKQKFVIVFADGKLGWYLDSPVEPKSRYQSMLRELLADARHALPVSSKPERTGICGWSMGGYGSMRFAEAFPGEVSAVATTIALLDFPNPSLPREQNFPVSPLFGKAPNSWPAFNCITDVEPLRGKSLLIVGARGAFDAQMNRNFHARLDSAGIAHTFKEVEGAHDFPTVQATLPMLFDFLASHLTSRTR